MKKRRFKYIALCVGLASMLAFAGCGSKDKDKSTEDTEITTEATTEATTEVTTEAQPEVDEDGFTISNDKVKTLDYVNVRTEPSTDGAVYQQMANDMELDRIGYNDEWSKISLDGGEYYIFSELLEVVGTSDDAASEDSTEDATDTTEAEDSSDDTSEDTASTSNVGAGKIIVIDAGHQQTADTETEPVGPAATEEKAKATVGNTGVSTGVAEYELNLEIAQKLSDELTGRGYTVKMIRTSNDVNISNATRAEYANNLMADAVIKIHSNGSTDDTATGVMTVCQTSENPYNAGIYSDCKDLATDVLAGMLATTGAESDGIWETDSMSGINWSTVPVTIVEVGYITTASEEQLLVTDDYQTKIVKGIADGVDKFISTR
jgi:N-acetylmuramoyl-L-alanine amidase